MFKTKTKISVINIDGWEHMLTIEIKNLPQLGHKIYLETTEQYYEVIEVIHKVSEGNSTPIVYIVVKSLNQSFSNI